jgi:hypothetical protein
MYLTFQPNATICMHCANLLKISARLTNSTKLCSTQKPHIKSNIYHKFIMLFEIEHMLVMVAMIVQPRGVPESV